MADSNYTTYGGATGANCFKEAVCINTGRIYDSCSAKDCLEDLRVYFTESVQPIIDCAHNIKCRSVEVLNVLMDVENVPFNQGFYSVDMTFHFLVTLDACSAPLSAPVACVGLAVFNKKVILYGSEGNVRNFVSAGCGKINPCDYPLPNTCPAARIQVVDPICLAVKFCDSPKPGCDCNAAVPCTMSCIFNGNFVTGHACRYVYISIGMFSIVQLEREVQMMVPVYDFSVPDKECVSSTADDPCELFKKIKFPVNEFFPPRLAELDCEETPIK